MRQVSTLEGEFGEARGVVEGMEGLLTESREVWDSGMVRYWGKGRDEMLLLDEVQRSRR